MNVYLFNRIKVFPLISLFACIFQRNKGISETANDNNISCVKKEYFG